MRPTRRRRSARICSLPNAIKISCKNGSDRKGAKIGFECQPLASMRGESIGIGSNATILSFWHLPVGQSVAADKNCHSDCDLIAIFRVLISN